ncbi:hypothetical protein [Capnocytophaga sputigena]|uniref:hypothetical protein n=1 Tax=Capnocytophaga sputigena TaxID=1019 RepID=UPI0028EE7B94|nr:hypothetical protein [Capnocytophaga sputigena]
MAKLITQIINSFCSMLCKKANDSWVGVAKASKENNQSFSAPTAPTAPTAPIAPTAPTAPTAPISHSNNN